MGTSGESPYTFEKTRDETPSIVLWGRTVISLLLIPLAIASFHAEDGRLLLFGAIDLAVHEFGHPLFEVVFLGNRTMTVLGGSLFQIIFPLFFAAYFLWPRDGRQRDVHAAMVCVWWCGLNMLDVSIYVGDSIKQQLMLLGGATGSDGNFHDWHWLLVHWNVLSRTDTYARRLRALGKLCCATGVIGGLLWTWWPKIAGSAATAPHAETT